MSGSLSIMYRNSSITGWNDVRRFSASSMVSLSQRFSSCGWTGSQPPRRLVSQLEVFGRVALIGSLLTSRIRKLFCPSRTSYRPRATYVRAPKRESRPTTLVYPGPNRHRLEAGASTADRATA